MGKIVVTEFISLSRSRESLLLERERELEIFARTELPDARSSPG
jgi:hypothetical protein